MMGLLVRNQLVSESGIDISVISTPKFGHFQRNRDISFVNLKALLYLCEMDK